MSASRYALKMFAIIVLVAVVTSVHIHSGHEDQHTLSSASGKTDPFSNIFSGLDSKHVASGSNLDSSKKPKSSQNPPTVSSQHKDSPKPQKHIQVATSGLNVKPKAVVDKKKENINKPVSTGVSKKTSVNIPSHPHFDHVKNQVSADEEYGKKTNLKKVGDFFIGKRNTTGEEIRIRVVGGDDTTFFPQPVKSYETDKDEYDVIVVGGGLAGTTAAQYLTDNNKKVLILEKEGHLGGLAAFRKDGKGFTYDRGAAYWTKAYNEEFQIMNHIGISKYFTEYIIPEPIDTYLWNGTLYGGFPHDGIWDYRTLGVEVPAKYKNGTRLPVLPSSFGIFKFECKNEDKVQNIPDQPFEQWKNLQLDTITAREWVRRMPQKFHKRISGPGLYARERRLWARFQEEIEKGVIDRNDPMKEFIEFLDLYCRSALGTTTDNVSALGFSNFYLSELEPRFTTPFGTGVVIQSLKARLQAAPNTHIKISSPVVNIKNVKDGVEVKYLYNGKEGRMAKGKVVVYSAQLTFAPNLIQDLSVKAPKQAKTMKDLPMAHYSVHNVDITNHPYRDSYDTWVRHFGYTGYDFTDMILGRWTELKGYGKGPGDEERQLLRDYSKSPDNKGSNLAIYHALDALDSSKKDKSNQIYGDYYSAHRAEAAWNRFEEIFGGSGKLRQEFKITGIVTSRWPYSIHITKPGHFSVRSQIMGKSFGNIVFGNNNLGTPSFEEALFRAHCAANKALYKLDPKGFVQQSWSKCDYKQ